MKENIILIKKNLYIHNQSTKKNYFTGMVRNAQGVLVCKPHAMENQIRGTCTMHDEEYSFRRFGHLNKVFSTENMMLPLVLPHVPEHRR